LIDRAVKMITEEIFVSLLQATSTWTVDCRLRTFRRWLASYRAAHAVRSSVKWAVIARCQQTAALGCHCRPSAPHTTPHADSPSTRSVGPDCDSFSV